MERRRSSDIDLLTLTIAAAASAVAAYVTSRIWQNGTLITAALTPVIVALVREGLARPVDRVSTVMRDRRTSEQPRMTLDEAPPPVTEAEVPDAEMSPVKVYGSGGGLHRRWKLAIATGLLAFAIVVAVFTLPELIAGGAVGGSGGSATTFFGGNKKDKDKDGKQPSATPEATETAQPEAEEATPAPTEAAPTPTPTAAATTAPTATPTPGTGAATPQP